MTDNEIEALIERLRASALFEASAPNGCIESMKLAGAPYPCSEDCPCALRDLVLTQADALRALSARVKETACPLGMDATPQFCSAGTCHSCLKARLDEAEARVKKLEAALIEHGVAVPFVASGEGE